jgi:hypothetical protein
MSGDDRRRRVGAPLAPRPPAPRPPARRPPARRPPTRTPPTGAPPARSFSESREVPRHSHAAGLARSTCELRLPVALSPSRRTWTLPSGSWQARGGCPGPDSVASHGLCATTIRRSQVGEDEEPARCGAGPSEPAHSGAPAEVKVGEQRSQPLDSAAARRAISHHQRGDHSGWCGIPATSDDVGRNPTLHVQGAEHGLDIGDLGLDLDDQHGMRRWMPREQVHTAAVSVVVEARLGSDVPAPSRQPIPPRRLQPRMTLVGQPIDLGTAPAGTKLEPHLQHGQAGAECPERQALNPATFEVRPRGPMHPRRRCAVHLTPPTPSPQGADEAAELEVAHGRCWRQRLYRPRTGRLPAARSGYRQAALSREPPAPTA